MEPGEGLPLWPPWGPFPPSSSRLLPLASFFSLRLAWILNEFRRHSPSLAVALESWRLSSFDGRLFSLFVVLSHFFSFSASCRRSRLSYQSPPPLVTGPVAVPHRAFHAHRAFVFCCCLSPSSVPATFLLRRYTLGALTGPQLLPVAGAQVEQSSTSIDSQDWATSTIHSRSSLPFSI